jgi:hypothetical protein
MANEKENLNQDEIKEQVVAEQPKPLFPEEVEGMSPEERILLLQELNTLGTLMGATWNKPIYVGKNTKNPEIQRSIPLNIFGEHQLIRMQKRAEAIMMKLQWFNKK